MPSNSTTSLLKIWLPVALFAVLWIDLIRQLSYQWDASEQYAYGWFVPFLAVALFWKRWIIRPSLQLSTLNPQPSTFSALPSVLVVLAVLAGLFLLPVRVVHEINPDWPLVNWLLSLLVVGFSIYAVYLAGGWPWVRHFVFPVCFILIAVRWPYRIEHGLTQGLMQVVATLTVEIIGWFNIPAMQRGNLIELSTGVVGVDEACSGIRSFQSTIMIAFFLGELYLLSLPRRALLLVSGVILSFCLNVVRTLILTWQAATSGLSALDKWHDPAGLMIFLVSFACLCGLALWIRPKSDGASPLSALPSPNPGSAPQPSTLNPQPSAALLAPRSALRTFLIVVGLWSIVCIIATEAWYRAHDIKDVGRFHWSAVLPEGMPGFAKVELPPRTLELLKFDQGATGRWREPDGTDWTLYFFRWNPSSVESVIHSRSHRPEVCLPASGLRQVSESILEFYDAGPFQIPFRKYVFQSEGRTLYVFFCQWEDGPEKQGGLSASKQSGRLQSVLTGRRLIGQQTLELILSGHENLAQAEAEVRRRLPSLIRPDATTAPLRQPSPRADNSSAVPL